MKRTTVFAAMLLVSSAVFAQGITTASDFFKSISDYYASVQDYEADVEIKAGRSDMKGRISFKHPEMLRIDFSDPSDQVIVFNGDDLTIYLPGSSAILEQSVDSSIANVNSNQGLGLLKRYYTIAYESGQEAIPLDETSDELVVKLQLSRRSSTEAFRVIYLAISPDTKLIRRVTAITPQNETFVFDITNYKLNTRMSDQRFLYDPPSSANNYNNFLLSE